MAPSQTTTMALVYTSTGSLFRSSTYSELEQTFQVSPTATSSCCETTSTFLTATHEEGIDSTITAAKSTHSAPMPTSATPTSDTPTPRIPTPTSATPTSATPTPRIPTPTSAMPTGEAPTTQDPDDSILGHLATLPVWVWVVVGIGSLFLLSCCATFCTMCCACLRRDKSDSQRTSQTSRRRCMEDGGDATASTTNTMETLYPSPGNSQDLELTTSGLQRSWSRRSSRRRVSTFQPERNSRPQPTTKGSKQQRQAIGPRPHPGSNNSFQTPRTDGPANPPHYQRSVPRHSPDRSSVPKPAPVNPHYNGSVPKPAPVNPHYNSSVPTPTPISPHYNSSVPTPTPISPHYNSSVPTPTPVSPHYNSSVPTPAPVSPHYNSSVPTPAPVSPHYNSSVPTPAPVSPHYQTPVPVSRPPPVNPHYKSPVPRPDSHKSPVPKPSPTSPHYKSPVPKPPSVNSHYKSPIRKPDSQHYKSPIPNPPPVNPHYQVGNSHSQTKVTQYYQGPNPIPDHQTAVTSPTYGHYRSHSECDLLRPELDNSRHQHQGLSSSASHSNQLIIPNPGYKHAFSQHQEETHPVVNEAANSYHNPIFGVQDSHHHHHH